jgi:hypothetical protein
LREVPLFWAYCRSELATILRRILGIPLNVDQALTLWKSRSLRAIDLGQVNDRTFLLYAALGLYPHFVREREQREQPDRRHTVRAFLRALWATLCRYPNVGRVAVGQPLGRLQAMLLTPAVRDEIFLTAAQSLFGIVLVLTFGSAFGTLGCSLDSLSCSS